MWRSKFAGKGFLLPVHIDYFQYKMYLYIEKFLVNYKLHSFEHKFDHVFIIKGSPRFKFWLKNWFLIVPRYSALGLNFGLHNVKM